jgi:hypothetical protein
MGGRVVGVTLKTELSGDSVKREGEGWRMGAKGEPLCDQGGFLVGLVRSVVPKVTSFAGVSPGGKRPSNALTIQVLGSDPRSLKHPSSKLLVESVTWERRIGEAERRSPVKSTLYPCLNLTGGNGLGE